MDAGATLPDWWGEPADYVFLYNARDCNWTSEVRVRGRPLRFSCDFILHLEAAGAHATRLEALEVRPQVVAGSHFGFTAHGLGIDWVETRRPVAPTRRDRVDLLARIRGSQRALRRAARPAQEEGMIARVPPIE